MTTNFELLFWIALVVACAGWLVDPLLGILLGGIIAEHLGYAAAFWSVALVNAIGSALFFMATKSFFLQRKLQ